MALSTTRVLGLAVGGGGLERGIAGALRRVGRTSRLVCAVEIEAYAAAVLATRMEEQAMDPAPVWSDLRTFDARPWRGVVDLVAAGYPCQPFSVAGHRRGADDPRHLWPHVARVVRDVEPAICVFENVSGHLSMGAHEVVAELQGMGFDVAATLWTAEEVGALHRRERVFIVAAHAGRVDLRIEQGRGERARREGQAESRDDGTQGDVADTQRNARGSRRASEPVEVSRGRHADRGCISADGVADSDCVRQLQPSGRERGIRRRPGDCRGWPAEPCVGRVANGVADRVERLRLLGNGVVPKQAEAAIQECFDALGIGW